MGDLEAASKGEFLGVQGFVKGPGGYVAIGRVSGKLYGRNGKFLLQHNGTMKPGESQMTITVVPDSGTELAGLQGTMTINIEQGSTSSSSTTH